MHLTLKELKQPASIKICTTLSLLDNTDYINWSGLRVILFATEEGLGCRETAEAISLTLTESTDTTFNHDMLLIIKDLTGNMYFHPTPEISALIEDYFEQIGDKFNSPEDIELYEELISDSDISNQSEEDCYESI